MVGEARCAGVSGVCGGGQVHTAALLHAGRHLRDGVSSDSRAASCGGVHVVLHHRRQHGNIVAFGAYHWVLGHGGVACFRWPGTLQPLF